MVIVTKLPVCPKRVTHNALWLRASNVATCECCLSWLESASLPPCTHAADTITAEPVAKLGGYHRECVRDCSWHPHLPLLATVSFDGSVALWEPEVPGAAEAAAEEEEAVAAQQHPGSGRKAGRVRRRGNELPAPLGDQSAWS